MAYLGAASSVSSRVQCRYGAFDLPRKYRSSDFLMFAFLTQWFFYSTNCHSVSFSQNSSPRLLSTPHSPLPLFLFADVHTEGSWCGGLPRSHTLLSRRELPHSPVIQQTACWAPASQGSQSPPQQTHGFRCTDMPGAG